EDIEEIREAAEKAASLTHQLLVFSSQEMVQTEAVVLNDVVGDMHKLLARTIGEHISLVTELAPDLPPVEAARSQIEQLVLNLAVNARDAMPDGGGRLTITTRNVQLGEQGSPAHGTLAPGSY